MLRRDSMGFVRQASAAALLVTMTLWPQSAGMAVLIDWAKARIGQGVQGMGHWRTSPLMVRSTTMVIVLHLRRFCCGRRSIAGVVFQPGNPAFTSRPPAIRPWATETLFF